MTIKGSGLLAIWSTVDEDFETDYLHWLTREHVFERVGVAGFRSGRVFRRRRAAAAMADAATVARATDYMIMYEQDDAQIMSSAAYQARLNQPSPWTQRVMPQLRNFRRGGGTIIRQSGNARAFGSCVGVARFEGNTPSGIGDEEALPVWAAIPETDRMVNMYAMEVAADGTQIATREKSMRRGEEGAFKAMLALEALDHAALARAIGAAAAGLAMAPDQFDTYDLVFSYVKRQEV